MKKTQPRAPKPTAYSYIRFSTPEQAKGDSLRRQTELAEAYCRRRGWTLDTSLTLRDLGVSAFRGDNALVGNLRTFLDAVKTHRITPGSVLIVESIDRISRQGIDEGYDLIKGILKADVRIVTLSPEREFDRDATRSLSKGALEIQLILERAAEESERKSERLGAAWKEKRRKAREEGAILTRRLPAWVEEKGGELRLIPERAAVVRRVFGLAAGGYGFGLIVKKLTTEGVPAFNGRAGGKKQKGWMKSYVARVLTDRRALGEFQPCDRKRKPDGPPIPGYFPQAVTEEEWLAARAGLSQRRGKRGRVSERINLFAGLLRNALDGAPYYATVRQSGTGSNQDRAKVALLVTAAAANCRGSARSFPLPTFEAAILSCLREINPSDILPSDDGPDETAVLAGELARVEDELAEATAFMEANGFSPTIGKRITDLERRKAELAAQLTEERARAVCPVARAWRDFSSLTDVLAKAPDEQDARLRLRAALRRIVREIRVLVVPRPGGRDRLAAVQVLFADADAHRDYLLIHRPAKANKSYRTEGRWYAGDWDDSFAGQEQAEEQGYASIGWGDLRKAEDVQNAERYLERLPQQAIERMVELGEPLP